MAVELFGIEIAKRLADRKYTLTCCDSPAIESYSGLTAWAGVSTAAEIFRGDEIDESDFPAAAKHMNVSPVFDDDGTLEAVECDQCGTVHRS